MRFAESSTLHRDELGGTLHGLLRVKHITQDDAHIFCTPRADRGRDLRLSRLRRVPLRPVRDGGDASSSRRGPSNKLGTDEEWDFTEGALRAGARAARDRVHGERGRRRVLRPEDRPAHDRRARPLVADGDDPARLARCRSGFGLPLHGRRQRRAHPVRRPPRAASARSSGSSASSPSTTPARSRSGSRPVQIRVHPGRRGPPRGRAALAPALAPYRVEVDDSDDTVGKRIRNAELEKIPYVVVYGDKESDEALAIREHGGGQSTLSLADFRAKLATLSPWQAGAEPSLTS